MIDEGSFHAAGRRLDFNSLADRSRIWGRRQCRSITAWDQVPSVRHCWLLLVHARVHGQYHRPCLDSKSGSAELLFITVAIFIFI
jgi:hypothetical protein